MWLQRNNKEMACFTTPDAASRALEPYLTPFLWHLGPFLWPLQRMLDADWNLRRCAATHPTRTPLAQSEWTTTAGPVYNGIVTQTVDLGVIATGCVRCRQKVMAWPGLAW